MSGHRGTVKDADALSADPRRFARYLRRSGSDFFLYPQPEADQARLRFLGTFDGSPVVWDCHFVTLRHEYRHHPGADRPPRLRCFIEVGAAGERGVPLRVGLNLERIDTPALRKMIIMIRHYRRLHAGRHEFGEYCTFADRSGASGRDPDGE